MAKNYTYTRTTADKFAIKGHLSIDGTFIDYINGEKDACTIMITDIFDRFKDADIALAISVKTDFDLDEEE